MMLDYAFKTFEMAKAKADDMADGAKYHSIMRNVSYIVVFWLGEFRIYRSDSPASVPYYLEDDVWYTAKVRYQFPFHLYK